MSDKYEVRDAACPISTKGGGGLGLLDLHEWRLARDEVRLVPPAAAREGAISGQRSSEGVPADPTDDMQTGVYSRDTGRGNSREGGGQGCIRREDCGCKHVSGAARGRL